MPAQIGWGIDYNGDGKFSQAESRVVNPVKFKWVDRAAYQEAVSEVNNTRAEWWLGGMTTAANFMYAFLEDLPTSGATHEIVNLQPNAFGTSHNVGAQSSGNIVGPIRRNKFAAGSDVSKQVAMSKTMSSKIAAMIAADRPAILAHLGNVSNPNPVPYDFTGTSEIGSINFSDFDVADRDLLFAIGALTFNHPDLPITTKLSVTAKVMYQRPEGSPDTMLYVYNIRVRLVAYDLYDFDFSSGVFGAVKVREAATVQAGFGTLGVAGAPYKAGHVFDTVIEVDDFSYNFFLNR